MDVRVLQLQEKRIGNDPEQLKHAEREIHLLRSGEKQFRKESQRKTQDVWIVPSFVYT